MTTEKHKIYIIYAIIGLIVFFIMKKNIKTLIENAKGKVKNTETEDGSSSDLSKTQLRTITDQLYDYMNQLGTNDSGIIKVSEELNGREMQQVFQMFGKRKYFMTGRSVYLGEDLNLFGWFDSELSGSNLKKVKSLWKKSGLKWI